MITWDPLLIKALFSFVTEFSYISGKWSETALLFKVHISRIQSGAHTSERAGQEMVKQLIPFPAEDILPKYKASSQPSCSKAKCIRLVLKPPPPASPRNTWSTAAFQHPSKPQYCPFLWVLVSRIWSWCCDTEIPFMKATSCFATESWLRKAIYNTSALALPLKYHWQVQLTPGQTYHSTF